MLLDLVEMLMKKEKNRVSLPYSHTSKYMVVGCLTNTTALKVA